MMTKREKLYFLIDHIEEARVITPSGQAILIDPTNDLNRRISDVELKQLFTKLEKDEDVLKVLQIPSGIKRVEIVEDLDPYDPPYQQDDGCWHIELLPAFDGYFSKIQLEPEYQDFTGKKPVGKAIKPNRNTTMTYEQKLDLIAKALIEAKKATRIGQTTTLYLNATNGLDCLDREEIRNILLQLQDEDILKLNPKTNRLLLLNQQPTNPTYFLLDILDGFDNWLIRYRMRQKSKPENLDWLNLLKALDVCSDIERQLQLARTNYVTIASFPYPYVGRFLELFPYDSIGTRKAYQQYRWEGVQYLIKEKAVFEAKYNNDDTFGYGSIGIKVNLLNFDEFHTKIEQEFEKRQKTDDKVKEKPKTIDKTAVKLKATYNSQKGELEIEDKKVTFKKDSFRAKLLELLLKDDKSRKKEWSWDEVIEAIEDTKDPDLTKEKKKKFYPACDGLSKHIASKTGVNDLLVFNKSTVQISSKYI